MRESLRVLAISGVLAVATALSPAIAQTESPAQDGSTAAAENSAQSASPAPATSAPSQVLAPATGASTPVVVPADDLKQAESLIRASWHDYEKCEHSKICSAYFESFGVGITFGDGEIIPFAHLQRLTTSRHDCIQNARDAAARGNRGLAVQWVMASQMMVPLDRNWLGDHPDAVLEALRHILF
jgi:hypothetical protein